MNKLFKHAFDPFQGKYFAVFLPVKRYSYPQEILLYAKFPPSFSHRATIEFLRARITSTLVTSKNNPFGTGFRKFCRANTKKNPTMFSATRPSPLSTWGWLLQWPGSPSIYNSEPDERNKTREEGC